MSLKSSSFFYSISFGNNSCIHINLILLPWNYWNKGLNFNCGFSCLWNRFLRLFLFFLFLLSVWSSEKLNRITGSFKLLGIFRLRKFIIYRIIILINSNAILWEHLFNSIFLFLNFEEVIDKRGHLIELIKGHISPE